MGDSSGQYTKLPPGWDCKYDQATGNCYYINYFTKAMQLEDPRMRYKPLQNDRCSTESIAMAPLHGSPYHVYPSNSYPAVRAFQCHTNSLGFQNLSASPLLSSRSNLEMSPVPVVKSAAPPQTPRLASASRRSTIQETSFSNQIDTDAVVTKIQNMFPTAEENHIRLLLKRYYNREAVVISALQVEKHPVTMPGPFVTPPAQRHLFHSNSAFVMTPPTRRLELASTSRGHATTSRFGGNASRTASPLPGTGRCFGSVMSMHSGGGGGGGGGGAGAGMGQAVAAAAVHGLYGQMAFHGSPRFGDQMRSSPKPHSSPKMKLRYMKNIFPKADETLLLDILANADNNVQTASEQLISMGYVKRDFAAAKVNNRSDLDADGRPKKSSTDEKLISLRPKTYTPEEKEAMKIRLKQKYHKIAERIILMALESVSYAEDRAIQILQIVQDEDETRERKTGELPQDVQPDASDAGEATTTDGVKVPHGEKSVSAKVGQQRLVPSINVTTPSTVTTKQIILTHESNNEAYDSSNNEKSQKSIKQKGASNSLEPSSSSTLKSLSQTLSSPSPSSSSSSSSPSQSFQTITTKSILERFNSTESGSSKYLRKSSGCTHTPSDSGILETLKLSRSRDKINSLKYSSRGSTEDDVNSHQRSEFKSILGRLATVGHNEDLAKGSDDTLLLADYVTWNGANPNISVGQKQMATGADAALLSERSCMALGRNPDLCKGPKPGLAKGSIYAQLTAAVENIKCN